MLFDLTKATVHFSGNDKFYKLVMGSGNPKVYRLVATALENNACGVSTTDEFSYSAFPLSLLVIIGDAAIYKDGSVAILTSLDDCLINLVAQAIKTAQNSAARIIQTAHSNVWKYDLFLYVLVPLLSIAIGYGIGIGIMIFRGWQNPEAAQQQDEQEDEQEDNHDPEALPELRARTIRL